MYIGHGHLSVCLSFAAFPHYCTDLDVTWANGRGCPVVVHYWVDLQLVHGFRCYDNIHVCKLIALYTAHAYSGEFEMSANDCTHCMPGVYCVCVHAFLLCWDNNFCTKVTFEVDTWHTGLLVDTRCRLEVISS